MSRIEDGDFTRAASRPGIFALVFLVLFLLSALVFVVMGKASNYQIYEFFSEYRLIHGYYPSAASGENYPIELRYRDYSPLNARIYAAIFSSSDPVQSYLFIFYQSALIVAGLFLCGEISKYSRDYVDIAKLSAVFIVANPLTYRVLGGDDKGALFLMPLLCIYAWRHGAVMGAATLGLFAGWTGIGAAAIPLLLFLPGVAVRQRIGLLLLAASLFVLLMFADGQDGLDAIRNRATRELANPFWFSIWRWLPEVAWPAARTPVIAAFIIGVLALFAKRRISYPVALVTIICAYLLFSNHTVPTRILFFAPLLMLCFSTYTARLRFLVFAFFAILISYALIKLPEAYSDLLIRTLGVALCNAVLVAPIANVFLRALRGSRQDRPADSVTTAGPT